MTSPTASFDNDVADVFQRYGALHSGHLLPYLRRTLTGYLRELREREGGGDKLVGLDAGCGSGRFTGLLADCCDQVLAVDAGEKAIRQANEEHFYRHVEFRHADMMALDPAEQRFGIVLCVNALFHVYDSYEPVDALRYLGDLVAPGGLLLIVDVVATPSRSRLRHRLRGLADAGMVLRDTRRFGDAAFTLKVRQSAGWLRHVDRHVPLDHATFERACHQAFAGQGTYTWPAGNKSVAGFAWRRPAD
ncbi:MAG: class I SAM-dependent methyltransferase [Mycobacteriales bacterium]